MSTKLIKIYKHKSKHNKICKYKSRFVNTSQDLQIHIKIDSYMGVWKSWNPEPDFWLKAELGHVVSELIFNIFMNGLVYAVKQWE